MAKSFKIGALVVGVLLLLGVGSLLAFLPKLSDGAKPGDFLYSYDRKAEEKQLEALAGDTEMEVAYKVELMNERLTEIVELVRDSNPVSLTFSVNAQSTDSLPTTESELLQEVLDDLLELKEQGLLSHLNSNSDAYIIAGILLDSSSDLSTQLVQIESLLSGNPALLEEVQLAISEIETTENEMIDISVDDKSTVDSAVLMDRIGEKILRYQIKQNSYEAKAEALGILDSVNESLVEAQSYIDEASVALDAGEYQRALLSLDSAEMVLDDVEAILDELDLEDDNGEFSQFEVLEKINKTRRLLEELNRLGATAENDPNYMDLMVLSADLLEQAQTEYDAGNYLVAKEVSKEAYENLKQAKKMLFGEDKNENVRDLEEKALDRIDEAKDKLMDLEEKLGEKTDSRNFQKASGNLTDGQALLAQAEAFYDEGRFSLAMSTALQAQSKARQGKNWLEGDERKQDKDETRDDEDKDERELKDEVENEEDRRQAEEDAEDRADEQRREEEEQAEREDDAPDDIDDGSDSNSADEIDDDDVLGVSYSASTQIILKILKRL